MKKQSTALLTAMFLLIFSSFSLQAQDYTYYNNLAKKEYENKNYYNAIDYATRSLSSSLNGEAYWWRGMARYFLNNYSDAASDFSSAISYYSSDRASLGKLYSWRGDCRFALKQNDEAISDYELSLSYGSENKMHLYWNEAAAYYNKGDFKKAEEFYTSAFNVATKTEDLAVLIKYRGDARGALYKYDEAIADFSKAIEYDPRFVRAFWQRGYYRAKKGQYELAIGDYTAAIKLVDPYNSSTTKDLSILYNNRGLHHYNLNHYTESLADLTESLKINPNYDYGNWNMGRTLAALHRYKEASTYYLMAASLMEKDIDRASCYNDLYWADRAQLDYGQALSHINEAIRLSPDYRGYQWNRAYLYLIRKENASALLEYDKVISRYNEDSVNLGSIYGESAKVKSRLKDYAGALKDLQKAVQLRPYSYRAFYDLGRHYKEIMKQNELAAINLQKAAELSSILDTTSSYAYAKAVKGERAEAVRIIDKLIKQESTNADNLKWELYNGACIHALTGNPTKALQYLEQSLIAGFDNFDHMYNDEDLDSLRQLPAFKALLIKYKVPVPKF